MNIENLEHLERILSDFDDEKTKMQSQIDQLEFNLEAQNWAWQRHRVFSIEEYPYLKELPVPRIEMRIENCEKGRHSFQWIYGIVYKHFTNSDDDRFLFVPISSTTTTGYRTDNLTSWETENLLPYRDGVHIKIDMKVLGLRAFLVIPEVKRVDEIFYNLSDYHDEIIRTKLVS